VNIHTPQMHNHGDVEFGLEQLHHSHAMLSFVEEGLEYCSTVKEQRVDWTRESCVNTTIVRLLLPYSVQRVWPRCKPSHTKPDLVGRRRKECREKLGRSVKYIVVIITS